MFEKQKITQEYTCTVQHQFVLHTTLCAGTLCAGITHNTMVIFHNHGGGAGRRRGRASRVNINLFFLLQCLRLFFYKHGNMIIFLTI